MNGVYSAYPLTIDRVLYLPSTGRKEPMTQADEQPSRTLQTGPEAYRGTKIIKRLYVKQ